MLKHVLLPMVLSIWSISAAAEEYCLALRGNGELAPAHWGATAKVVERLGLPRAQAGGSSASITMFLLDAIASNKLVKDAPTEEQRRLHAALLIKSLEGYANHLLTTDEFKEFQRLYLQFTSLASAKNPQSLLDILSELQKAEQAPLGAVSETFRRQLDSVQKSLATATQLGLVSASISAKLGRSFRIIVSATDPQEAREEAAQTRFFVSELIDGINSLGAFDAASDANLFFRPEIVDFAVLGSNLGRIASFYELASETQPERWKAFVDKCATAAQGKPWAEFAGATGCGADFVQLIRSFRHDTSFASEPVGKTIKSFPTTAVLVGSAAEDALAGFRNYYDLGAEKFGMKFQPRDPSQVKFGYWGSPSDLAVIKRHLPAGDAKSERFFSLGRTAWAEVLGLSPAEPGLAPLKPLSRGDEKLFSAGGWSDLHPVQVLKASGCEKVVYITRRGGESLFAQGVANRLLGLGRDWSALSTRPESVAKANAELNIKGDPTDMTSPWSRLFNMANPKSSIREALASADAILCTDWNRFSLKEGPGPMILESYAAPFAIPKGSQFKDTSKFDRVLAENEKPVGCF